MNTSLQVLQQTAIEKKRIPETLPFQSFDTKVLPSDGTILLIHYFITYIALLQCTLHIVQCITLLLNFHCGKSWSCVSAVLSLKNFGGELSSSSIIEQQYRGRNLQEIVKLRSTFFLDWHISADIDIVKIVNLTRQSVLEAAVWYPLWTSPGRPSLILSYRRTTRKISFCIPLNTLPETRDVRMEKTLHKRLHWAPVNSVVTSMASFVEVLLEGEV